MASQSSSNDGPPPTFKDILNKAAGSAIRGGTAGAVAMGANVACLMWMRTTVSYKAFLVSVCFYKCLEYALVHVILMRGW
jgi:hypothetical protein